MEKQLSFFNDTKLIEVLSKTKETIHYLIDSYYDEDSVYYCDDHLVFTLIGLIVDAIVDIYEEKE